MHIDLHTHIPFMETPGDWGRSFFTKYSISCKLKGKVKKKRSVLSRYATIMLEPCDVHTLH